MSHLMLKNHLYQLIQKKPMNLKFLKTPKNHLNQKNLKFLKKRKYQKKH